MHWLTRGLDFADKLPCTGSLEAWILVANCHALAHYRPRFWWQNIMHWLTRSLDFGGKLSCTGSLEAWILETNCHAQAH